MTCRVVIALTQDVKSDRGNAHGEDLRSCKRTTSATTRLLTPRCQLILGVPSGTCLSN